MRLAGNAINQSIALAVLTAFLAAPGIHGQVFLPPEPSYVVAQSDYGGQNGNFGGVTAGYPFTQTFTAATGGTLYSLSGGFYAPESGIHPYYIFQFRDTTANGLPSSQVLASVNVSTSPLTAPSYAWIDLTADFSGFQIRLMPGHKYAFSIDVPGPFGSTTYNNFFWGTTRTGYGAGDIFFIPPGGPVLLDSSNDLLFTVRAVPEPSAILLWMLSGLILFARYRINTHLHWSDL